MTWNEFKTIVDRELREQGKSGEKTIFFIDTGSYPDVDSLEVIVDRRDEIVINR